MRVHVSRLCLCAWLVGSARLFVGQATPVRPVVDRTGASTVLLKPSGPSLWRLSGTDEEDHIQYVRLLLTGRAGVPAVEQTADEGAKLREPTLTGQCTQDALGKLHFEMFVNFGSVEDAAFYPPWHSTGQDDLFAPRTTKVTLSLEFLGYTKVKPFRRQFEQTQAPGPEQLRYLNPGSGSANMEPPAFFFRYLRSLPTLRVTSSDGRTATFETSSWLDRLHQERLCAASGA